MNLNKLLQSKKHGSAMALVLVAVILLLVMGIGLLSLGQHSRIFAVQTTSEIAARCAADAGLTKALFEMNSKLENKTWSDSVLPQVTNELLPNSNATFSYEITGDQSSGFTIQSTGSFGRAQKTVNAELQLKGLFEYAIFTQGALALRNGTAVTGYNFDADDEPLKVGTNSTAAGSVEMKTGVTINGDVRVGIGGDVDVVINSRTEATITGDVSALNEEHELPPITVPNNLLSLPSQGIIISPTIITTSAKYDSIKLGNSGIITIDGSVTLYVVGDVILDNSAQLQIVAPSTNPNASLVLYLGGNLLMQNGGTINNLAKNPTKLKIYALDSCTSISFKNSGNFYGAIYAPAADVHQYNSVQLYGAIVANTFRQDVNANLNYDASLRDVSVNDEGTYFTIKRWWEH